MDIIHHRKGLPRTRSAIANKRLTIGFIGGSITDLASGCPWPESVIAWFLETFPDVRLTVENAAIGATGSELAVFRTQRELIDRGCDLVFVEYSVNDYRATSARRGRTREGLIRKLLADEGRDVVLAYPLCREFYADIIENRVPASISEFEAIGQHYGLGSIWMGKHAVDRIQAGELRWHELLPDGIHPGARGSLVYGQSVIAYLQRELIDAPSDGAAPTGDRRPAPLDPLNWEFAASMPLKDANFQSPITLRGWRFLAGAHEIIDTAAVGSKMSIDFEGRGVALGFEFGKRSCEFTYRLDGGDPVTTDRERPAWLGEGSMWKMTVVDDELTPGRHHLDIETILGKPPECTGTDFRLALIGVVK